MDRKFEACWKAAAFPLWPFGKILWVREALKHRWRLTGPQLVERNTLIGVFFDCLSQLIPLLGPTLLLHSHQHNSPGCSSSLLGYRKSWAWVMKSWKIQDPSTASTFDREPAKFTQSHWFLQSLSKEEELLHGGAPQSLGAALLAVIKCYLAKWSCSIYMWYFPGRLLNACYFPKIEAFEAIPGFHIKIRLGSHNK